MKNIYKYIILFFQAWAYANAKVNETLFSHSLGACGLVAISSSGTECVDSDGGISEIWIADCDDINYVLPDAETIKQYDFNPSYNVLSVINTKDTSKKVETTVIA
jgi:hypothetical protein